MIHTGIAAWRPLPAESRHLLCRIRAYQMSRSLTTLEQRHYRQTVGGVPPVTRRSMHTLDHISHIYVISRAMLSLYSTFISGVFLLDLSLSGFKSNAKLHEVIHVNCPSDQPGPNRVLSLSMIGWIGFCHTGCISLCIA